MKKPHLNSLKIFSVAARKLNFRLAADELNLTQGAVAQQVRKLESDLGVLLFTRRPRGLELTEKGSDYYLSVARALVIIDEATQKLKPEETTITLSLPPSLASKWLVVKLGEFSATHPSILVQTIATASLTNFYTDNVDLAIRQGKPPFDKELNAKLLFPLDLCAVRSPSFKEKIDNINELNDCRTHTLIQDSHKLWEKYFEQQELKIENRIVQFNQTTLAIDAAVNGQGIALAPYILLENELQQGRLVKLCSVPREEEVGYYIVYPKSKKYNPARDTFINWIFLKGVTKTARYT